MKILLIGDYCRDVFVQCDVIRLSPEAPVPVVLPHGEISSAGMGGNVFENLKSLAPKDWQITAIVSESKSIKTRYVDKNTGHHFLRVDSEDAPKPIHFGAFAEGLKTDAIDAVVVSDYDKGFLDEQSLTEIAGGCETMMVPLFIDTKKPLGAWARDAIVKINQFEYVANLKANVRPQEICRNLIVTLGAGGMRLWLNGQADYLSHSVGEVEVKDGAGCGDSVLAALVIGYLENGRDLKGAMDWANEVGAIAVSKRGVVAVKREEVK